MVVCRYLGDVLLATPLARSLKLAGYEVDWVVAPGTEGVLEGQACAAQVFTVGPQTPWREQIALAGQLWRNYEQAFALPSSDRSMLLALAASKRVHALTDAGRRQEAWKRFVCKTWQDYTPGAHMVALACKMAEANGLPACRDVQIEWDEADTGQVFADLPWERGTPYIHIHPFARWAYKWWRKSAWRELIRAAQDSGFRVVITGAPAEDGIARQMADGFEAERVHVAAGSFNWRQLACLAHHAEVYVGLDTANTHLAAAGNAKVVALFGPTDPRIWGPWPNGFTEDSPWQGASDSGVQRQGNISLLQGRQECVPCQLEGCEQRQDSISQCLKQMPADWVWQEVVARIGMDRTAH